MDKENKLVGAVKRKSYKRKFGEERASTPGDRYEVKTSFLMTIIQKPEIYFSGFKERSPSEQSITVTSVDSSASSLSKPNELQFARQSGRLKVRKAKNSKANVSDDKLLLHDYIIRKRLMRRKESTADVGKRFLPRVLLTRISPREIDRLKNDWSFLYDIKCKETFSARCEILAQQKSLNNAVTKVLVKWTPTGIFDDQWIEPKQLSIIGIRNFKIQSLTWEQKLLVRDKLFTKLWLRWWFLLHSLTLYRILWIVTVKVFIENKVIYYRAWFVPVSMVKSMVGSTVELQ